MLAPYAGSKNFLYAWSQALGGEYAKKGIRVQLLNTFFVVSLRRLAGQLNSHIDAWSV